MNFFIGILNNREIAITVWVLIAFTFVLFQKKTRVSLFDIFRTLTSLNILLVIFLMLSYVLITILVLQKTGLWNISMTKDTIIWTFGVAFIMLMNLNKAQKDKNYFKKLILNNVKLVIALEFTLIPVLVIVAMITAYSETKKEYNQVIRELNRRNQNISLILEYNNYLLEATHHYQNLKGILETYNNMFTAYYYLYRKAYRIFEVIKRKLN